MQLTQFIINLMHLQKSEYMLANKLQHISNLSKFAEVTERQRTHKTVFNSSNPRKHNSFTTVIWIEVAFGDKTKKLEVHTLTHSDETTCLHRKLLWYLPGFSSKQTRNHNQLSRESSVTVRRKFHDCSG